MVGIRIDQSAQLKPHECMKIKPKYESFQRENMWRNKAIHVLLLGCVVSILYFIGDFKSHETRKSTDPGFVLLAKEMSPDQRHIALTYQYDQGALGFSRIWWAVAPQKFQDVNLADFELPDGYKISGWDEESGDLIVKKWEPYYDRKEYVDLSTGNILHGVHIRVVPSF